MSSLENACKKFIEKDELDSAWTIISLINESSE